MINKQLETPYAARHRSTKRLGRFPSHQTHAASSCYGGAFNRGKENNRALLPLEKDMAYHLLSVASVVHP